MFFSLTNVAFNGWRYGKCGNRLLLNCQPAQMYIKISNTSTNKHTRICYSVCWAYVLHFLFVSSLFINGFMKGFPFITKIAFIIDIKPPTNNPPITGIG